MKISLVLFITILLLCVLRLQFLYSRPLSLFVMSVVFFFSLFVFVYRGDK